MKRQKKKKIHNRFNTASSLYLREKKMDNTVHITLSFMQAYNKCKGKTITRFATGSGGVRKL